MFDLSKLNILENVENQEVKKDFKKLENSLFVDISEELKPQPVAISIGESLYKNNYYPIPYGSYGDFSCIVGASKSKKTFLKSLLLARYIGGNSNVYASNIKGHNTKDKIILDIDTEQSKHHVQRVARRVSEMIEDNYSLYKPYFLRELSPPERMEFVEWLIMESDYKNDLGIVAIDGIADLISDINSVEQSTKLTDNLLRWTSKSQSHIITVLHRNFGSLKPTGHVGSFVLKKAETIVFVENSDGEVIVKPEYTRNKEFEQFSFYVNENWIPVVNNNNSFF